MNLLDVDPELFNMSDEYVSKYIINFDLTHKAISEIYRLGLKRTVQHLANGNDLPLFVISTTDKKSPASTITETITPEEIVHQIHAANPFPEAYFRISELLNTPQRSATKVAETISSYASLSTTLLELVNSPLYAFPSHIDNMYQAVSVLGAEELNTLILGISVHTFFKQFVIPAESSNHFWKHAILCGCISKLLAQLLPGVTIERFFVAGLLHDIGKLAIAIAAPKQNVRIQEYALEHNVPDYQAEQHILGFDHTLVGKMLLEDWMVPKAIAVIASFHHDPMQSELTLEPAIVHLADILTLAIDTATIKPSFFPALAHEAWESLGFPTATLEPVATQAEKQALAISGVFITERSAP